jgi:hypothetical protein
MVAKLNVMGERRPKTHPVEEQANRSRPSDRQRTDVVMTEPEPSPAPAGPTDTDSLEAYELAMSGVLERAGAAATGEQYWSARIRIGLRALLDELAGRPDLARACALVEERSEQRPVRAARDPVVQRLGTLLCSDGADGPAAGALSARNRAVLADGVLEAIAATVRADSPAALPGLLVQLHWWVVALRAR